MPFSLILVVIIAGGIAILGIAVAGLMLLRTARLRLHESEKQRIEMQEHQRQLNTELLALRNRVAKGELMDNLTGLPGRQIFEDRLVLTLSQSSRYKLTCSVMFLNLDHFRIVNDALGLEAGDQILKEVTERLKESVRELDTVSRFAGDEFVLLFPQINRAETAGYIAQRILDNLSRPYRVLGEDVWLTASLGIAVFPEDGKDVRTLIQNADAALHQAKAHGRNTYQFYRKEMHAQGKRELVLVAGLRNELLFHDFTIDYQPEIQLKTRQIVCMDALLHWQNPELGTVELADFIHLAENTGKITGIGEWMVRTVAQDMLAWREQALPMTAVLLPLSLKQLEKMHFVHFLSTVLQEYHLEPEQFVFEITDTVGLVRMEAVEKMLGMMKHLGVRLAINGLGTDNLSLKNLHRLPADVFRINAPLVRDLTLERENQVLARMIIALAKSLNANVVAEGVESQAQEKILMEMGCLTMQGRLFGSPVAGHQFNEALIHEIFEATAQPVS